MKLTGSLKQTILIASVVDLGVDEVVGSVDIRTMLTFGLLLSSDCKRCYSESLPVFVAFVIYGWLKCLFYSCMCVIFIFDLVFMSLNHDVNTLLDRY